MGARGSSKTIVNSALFYTWTFVVHSLWLSLSLPVLSHSRAFVSSGEFR